MAQILMKKLDRYMDFYYGYLILKAYIFRLRFSDGYFNIDYFEKWKSFIDNVDFNKLIDRACDLIKNEMDGRILDIADVMERASYFALIHPNHPNITLGFLKDADLWNLWLETGIYSYARKVISENAGIGKGDRIIDFGCGSASPSHYSEFVGQYGFYTGVDYSRPLLRIARSNCREKNLLDRVKLIQGFTESKMEFTKKYDIAVLSSILEYTDVRAAMKNAVNAIGHDGKIIVFSEVFRDIQPERAELFELYYSLIPNFRQFPSLNEIQNFLDFQGIFYRLKRYGSHLLMIEVCD